MIRKIETNKTEEEYKSKPFACHKCRYGFTEIGNNLFNGKCPYCNGELQRNDNRVS